MTKILFLKNLFTYVGKYFIEKYSKLWNKREEEAQLRRDEQKSGDFNAWQDVSKARFLAHENGPISAFIKQIIGLKVTS
mgnify:CR=1 FL=1